MVVDGHIDNLRYVQLGERDHLLCEVCEGIINTNYENPYLLGIHSRFPATHYDNPWRISLDVVLFKLFHLSVLWRMQLATTDVWENVTGLNTVEMLSDLKSGKQDACAWFDVFGYIVTDDFGIVRNDFLVKPFVLRDDEANLACSCWGGFEWYYKLPGNNVAWPDFPPGNRKTFPVIPFSASASVNGFISYMQKAGPLPERKRR